MLRSGLSLARRLASGITLSAGSFTLIALLSFSPDPDPAPCVPDKKNGEQHVLLLPQETTSWCWAASGQMCLAFFKKKAPQCDQANKQFSTTVCCDNPIDSKCLNGGWPEFEKYGFTPKIKEGALTWVELTTEIYCKEKPIAFSWHYVGTGGHMMVAYGYEIIDDSRFVLIHDPLPMGKGDTRRISYEEYVSSEEHHTHWNDYYDITETKKNN